MIEQQQQQQAVKKCPPVPVRTGIVVKMANALRKAMMVKIAVKMERQKWIAAKTANAPKKGMMVKTAAKTKKIININLSNRLI
jgi:hypothetical protein